MALEARALGAGVGVLVHRAHVGTAEELAVEPE
jgi:hypothetical protein